MKLWRLIAPGLTTGFATVAIIGLALGAAIPRWVAFTWPAIVIIWSLSVASQEYAERLNRETIESQRNTIRKQAELLGQLLRH